MTLFNCIAYFQILIYVIVPYYFLIGIIAHPGILINITLLFICLHQD